MVDERCAPFRSPARRIAPSLCARDSVDQLCASQGTGTAARDRTHNDAAAVRFGIAAQRTSSCDNYLWTTDPEPNGGACGGLLDCGDSVHRDWRRGCIARPSSLLYNRTLPLEAVLPKQEIEEVQILLPVHARGESRRQHWSSSLDAASTTETTPHGWMSRHRSRPLRE